MQPSDEEWKAQKLKEGWYPLTDLELVWFKVHPKKERERWHVSIGRWLRRVLGGGR